MSDTAVIEYQKKIVMIAAIKSINTFASKGGGLSLDITTKDVSVFSDLVSAKTNVCKVIISSVLINVSSGVDYKILKEVELNGTIKSPVLKQENRTVEFKIESTNDQVAETLSMYNTTNGELFFYKIQIAVSSAKIKTDYDQEEPSLDFDSDDTDIDDDAKYEEVEIEDNNVTEDEDEEYEEFEIEDSIEAEDEDDDDDFYEDDDDDDDDIIEDE